MTRPLSVALFSLAMFGALTACGPQSLIDSDSITIGVTPPETSDNAKEVNANDDFANVAAANSADTASATAKAKNGSGSSNGSLSQANNNFGSTAYDLSTLLQEVWPAHEFNDEQENYTKNGKNVTFEANGSATITARPTGGTSWSSARLSGPTLKETGGIPQYVEATLILPTGKGTWPAFWLTSRGSWPQGSEVDVMEVVNGVNQSHISTHWGPTTGKTTFNTHEIIKNVNVAKAHRYGAYITDSTVQFYLDGEKVGDEVTMPKEANFAKLAPNLIPIVNLAMGGNFPGNAPQSAGAQTMVIQQIIHSKNPPQ